MINPLPVWSTLSFTTLSSSQENHKWFHFTAFLKSLWQVSHVWIFKFHFFSFCFWLYLFSPSNLTWPKNAELFLFRTCVNKFLSNSKSFALKFGIVTVFRFLAFEIFLHRDLRCKHIRNFTISEKRRNGSYLSAKSNTQKRNPNVYFSDLQKLFLFLIDVFSCIDQALQRPFFRNF